MQTKYCFNCKYFSIKKFKNNEDMTYREYGFTIASLCPSYTYEKTMKLTEEEVIRRIKNAEPMIVVVNKNNATKETLSEELDRIYEVTLCFTHNKEEIKIDHYCYPKYFSTSSYEWITVGKIDYNFLGSNYYNSLEEYLLEINKKGKKNIKEVINMLESIDPKDNQGWNKQYKSEIVYVLRYAIKILSNICIEQD